MESYSTAALSALTLSSVLGRGTHTRGFKKVVYLNPTIYQKLQTIRKKTNRPIGAFVRYFVESGIFEGALKYVHPGDRVQGYSVRTSIEFEIYKKWLYSLDDLAWLLQVEGDKSSHLIGLLIQLQITSKSENYWINFFTDGSDLLYRTELAIKLHYYDRHKRKLSGY